MPCTTCHGVGVPLVHDRDPVEPGVPRAYQHGSCSSGNAPEMQPDHSTGSFRKGAGGAASSLTMSEMAMRPPTFRTRKSRAGSWPFQRVVHEVQHAVRHHDVHRVVRDHRQLAPEPRLLGREFVRSYAGSTAPGGRLSQHITSSASRSSWRSWMRPRRNSTFAVAGRRRDRRRRAAGEVEHVVVHVDADHPARTAGQSGSR